MTETSHQGGRSRTATCVLFGAMFLVLALLLAPLGADAPASGGVAAKVVYGLLSGAAALAGILIVAMRRRLAPGNLWLAAATALVCVALCEAGLGIAGVQPARRAALLVPPFAEGFEDGAIRGQFLEAEYAQRWTINESGFPDFDEFTPESAAAFPRRILVLGDSFAFGAAASSQESGFAELLDQALDDEIETVVWNTGIPGRGQQWELECLETYAPRLKPQIVIATLFANDFTDNVYPLDQYIVFRNGTRVHRYERRPDGSLIRLSPAQAYRRAFAPKSPHGYLKTLRLFTALDRVLDRRAEANGRGAPTDPAAAEGIEETREYLGRIRDWTERFGARLVVLLIPTRADTIETGPVYGHSLEICRDLSLRCVDPIADLTRRDYAPPPNGHWLDSGHAKAAALLVDAVETEWREMTGVD